MNPARARMTLAGPEPPISGLLRPVQIREMFEIQTNTD